MARRFDPPFQKVARFILRQIPRVRNGQNRNANGDKVARLINAAHLTPPRLAFSFNKSTHASRFSKGTFINRAGE